jgi:hypothetical protein
MAATRNGWVECGDEDDAEEFARYLAEHCIWSLDDFGGDYPWRDSVPCRDQWKIEVDGFNDHLRSMSN